MPTIDPDAIRAWCDTVFGYLTGHAPVRLLAESGTPDRKPELLFPTADHVADTLVRLAARAADEARGVFVVPGTVARPGSARAADIIETGVVLVDLDHGDPAAARDHLARHLGEPTLEVASGGVISEGCPKLHLLWRLTEPATGDGLALVARLRATIAAKVGGDTSFASIHQPIRVAGSIHGKHGRRAAVRLTAHRIREYDLGELAMAIDAMPPLPGVAVNVPEAGEIRDRPSTRDLTTRRVRAAGQDGITRFDAMTRVIGHWIRAARTGACTIDEARMAVLDHNAAMLQPPWEDARVLREFEAILARDVTSKGPMKADHDDLPRDRGDLPAPPPLSDDALATAFVDTEGPRWRHVPAWGQWFHWTGRQWRIDETIAVREAVRQVCRSAAAHANSVQEARRIAGEKTLSAVLRVAASDPRLATATDAWDRHIDLLNTPAGVVDLRTGEVAPHDPDLLMTQMTTASPGSGCPLWRDFLDRVTGGDRELQAYLARLAGYCLTGTTTEQVFVFLHGHGANGKSVFLQTLAQIMGSYAATATLDTFMATRSGRHLTELAGLRAARLVLVPETEAGQQWAEARIKQVTGGEKIRANFMHRDHFEYRPQFKLIVAGNHRPALSGVGEAMRRRLHLIPFGVTIPLEQRDPRLGQRLLAERDGILGWMLMGCAEWRKIGLQPPASVTKAADAYLAAEDHVGQWIEECCVLGREFQEQSAVLYRSWKSWAEGSGIAPGSTKSLGEQLRARGFDDLRVRRARGRAGIALNRAGPGVEGGA